MELKSRIRDVRDFPKPGIIFKDICPLLQDGAALKAAADEMAAGWEGITRVVGIESRGFIFGALIAERLGVGMALARKRGKLPAATISQSYALEYGEATLELHRDAVGAGDEVLVVDDLLATGGTLEATCRLIEQCGARVASCVVLIELGFLEGRARLKSWPLRSILTY